MTRLGGRDAFVALQELDDDPFGAIERTRNVWLGTWERNVSTMLRCCTMIYGC